MPAPANYDPSEERVKTLMGKMAYRDDMLRCLAEINGYLPIDQQWSAAEILDELVAKPCRKL